MASMFVPDEGQCKQKYRDETALFRHLTRNPNEKFVEWHTVVEMCKVQELQPYRKYHEGYTLSYS